MRFYFYDALDINGKSRQATLIATPEIENFKATHLIIDLVTATGVVTPPTISIGTNISAYNNIYVDSLLTGLNATSNSTMIALSGLIPNLIRATGIYINVGVIATATAYTFNVRLIGFYDI